MRWKEVEGAITRISSPGDSFTGNKLGYFLSDDWHVGASNVWLYPLRSSPALKGCDTCACAHHGPQSVAEREGYSGDLPGHCVGAGCQRRFEVVGDRHFNMTVDYKSWRIILRHKTIIKRLSRTIVCFKKTFQFAQLG